MNEVLLGEISEIQAGPFGTQLHASDYVDFGIPMLNAKNIGNGTVISESFEYVSEVTCRKLPQYLLAEGDIVFGRAGSIERHTHIDKKYSGCFQGTNCIRIRLRNPSLSIYVSYYLWLPEIKKQIGLNAGGTTLPYLNSDILKNLKIKILDEERANEISRILLLLDEKIFNNRNVIRELEAMAKTIYDYWFVQFDFPNAESKPYRASGGEMEWNEQLKRNIPKGWDVSALPKECSIIDCLHSAKPEMVFEAEDYYLLQLENLVEHGLVSFVNKYYVTKEMYEVWTSRIEVVEGDLVITNAGRVGSVARIPHNIKAGIGRNMTAIRPENIPPCFLYYFITGSDVAGQIKVNTDTGSFFGSLNVRGIKELLMTLPPKNARGILNDFDHLVYPLRRKIELCAQENQELTNLRDWLLPMLMNGQVTVE